MAKVIQVVHERYCCEYHDLVAEDGQLVAVMREKPAIAHCKYCNQVHEHYQITDGSWVYRPTRSFD